MKNVTYAFAIGNLTYAKVCTRPNIVYVIGVLGRYLSDLGQRHWTATKRVMRYLQVTKNYMLTYRRFDDLTIIGYLGFHFVSCLDDHKSTSGYIFIMVKGVVSRKSIGKASSSHIQQSLVWKQSMSHVMKLSKKLYD